MDKNILFIGLAILFFGLHVNATTTENFGVDYITECENAGVPVPDFWDPNSDDWSLVQQPDAMGALQRAVDIRFLLNPDANDPTFIFEEQTTVAYIHTSTRPRGMCMALPRIINDSDPRDMVATMGLICQGSRTGKACFFEVSSSDTSLGQLFDLTERIPLTAFESGADLESHTGGVCSDCHSGENIFIVHPFTTLQRNSENPTAKINVNAFLQSDRWVDPIVAGTWPQNPGPMTSLTGIDGVELTDDQLQNTCLGCHELPQVSKGIGREGDSFCNTILKNSIDITMPTGSPGSANRFKSPDDPTYNDDDRVVQALIRECSKDPAPQIIFPTEANPENAGDRNNPGKIWVQIIPPLRRNFDPTNYSVKINGELVDEVSGSKVDGQLWLVVKPKPVANATQLYDVEVTAIDTGGTATRENAVKFLESGRPVDLMIVGDVSGSMMDFGKIDAAKSAAGLYVNHARVGDKLGVVRFSNVADTEVDLALSNVVNAENDPTINEAISDIDAWSPGGATALGEGMLKAVNEFRERGVSNHDWRMALLSDDLENRDPKWFGADMQVKNAVTNVANGAGRNIPVDMVSLGPDAALDLAQNVASETSGRYFRVSPEVTSQPPVVSATSPGQFVPVSLIDGNVSSLPNRLADVYKSMAEGVRKEQRIGDWDGELVLNESDEFSLTLESGLPEVLIAVHWDDPTSDMLLLINEETCYEQGGETRFESTHMQCRFLHPAPGVIDIEVLRLPPLAVNDSVDSNKGKFIPVQSVPDRTKYKLMVSAYANTTAMKPPELNFFKLGDLKPFVIYVGDNSPITGITNIWLDIIDQLGNISTFQLFDDGANGDGGVNDGFYGRMLKFDLPGHFRANVTVAGINNGGDPFKRSLTDTIFIEDRIALTTAALVATDSLVISDRSKVVTDPEGDIFIGQNFEIGADAEAMANIFVNGNATMRSHSRIDGDLTLSQSFNQQNNTTVTGDINANTPVTVPALPIFDVQFGTQNITLNNAEEGTWQPGAYGDATVRARSTLTLRKGKYFFRSLNIEPDASIILADSLEDTEIFVENNFQLGNFVKFENRTTNLRIYTNSQNSVNIGTDINFNGTLIAPNAQVQIFARGSAARVGAKTIRIEPDSLLIP